MQVLKIICHDKREFWCKTENQLQCFISNYRRLEGKKIRQLFPNEIFLVKRIKKIEMTENEYLNIPATIDSNKYFGAGKEE